MEVICDKIFVVSLRIINDEYLVLIPAVFDDKDLTIVWIGISVGTCWNVGDICDNIFKEKEDVVDKIAEVGVGEDNCVLLKLGGVLISKLVDITLST